MRILLVEDNHLFGEFIGAHIENVTAVETLSQALDILNQERFDLLLVDLGLPDSQGINTLKAFSHLKTPKIVMTASSQLVREASKIGCIDFIYKSDPEEIVSRLQFNINKLDKKRIRFEPQVFEQLKACLCPIAPSQLTLVH